MQRPSKTPRPLQLSSATRRKRVPYPFVLDAIANLHPTTRAMFGALGVYVADKIVFILRDRPADPGANGVWVAISDAAQESLVAEFPNALPVHIMGKDISGWRLLPARADDFEESALHACDLVSKGDARIGKVPKK